MSRVPADKDGWEEDGVRALVVCCNPFSTSRNNGLTMLNLFWGWPTERLGQIYIESSTSLMPDFSTCNTYWKISPLSAIRTALGSHRTPPLPKVDAGAMFRA